MESFEKFPPEIQSLILSIDKKVLALSQRISKNIGIITRQSYEQNIFTLPISNHELLNFTNNYIKNNIVIIDNIDGLYRNTIYQYIGNQYYKNTETLMIHDNKFALYKYGDNQIVKNIIYYDSFFIDLLTSYFIYSLRNCSKKIVKQLLLKELDYHYSFTNFKNLKSLYNLRRYIYINLSKFPILLPLNKYYRFNFITNFNGEIVQIINNNQNIDIDYFMNDLTETINYYYQLLKEQIEK